MKQQMQSKSKITFWTLIANLELDISPDRLGVGDGLDDLVRRDDAVRGRRHQPVQSLANLKYFPIS